MEENTKMQSEAQTQPARDSSAPLSSDPTETHTLQPPCGHIRCRPHGHYRSDGKIRWAQGRPFPTVPSLMTQQVRGPGQHPGGQSNWVTDVSQLVEHLLNSIFPPLLSRLYQVSRSRGGPEKSHVADWIDTAAERGHKEKVTWAVSSMACHGWCHHGPCSEDSSPGAAFGTPAVRLESPTHSAAIHCGIWAFMQTENAGPWFRRGQWISEW